MKCYLCNKPAKFLCSCVERKFQICYTHMKSHIRESNGHVFEFFPEILKNYISSKVRAELHLLKKNVMLKSSNLIGNIQFSYQQDLQGQKRELQSEYLQRMSVEISQIRETTRIELQGLNRAMESTKNKQENYELTAKLVEMMLFDLKKSKFLSPLLSRLEELVKSISPKMLQISNIEYVGQVVNGKAKGRGKSALEGGVFEGYWKNNVMDGIGILNTEMFSHYGEWKVGKQEGRGILRFASGNCYDGEWKEGKKEGRGILRFC